MGDCFSTSGIIAREPDPAEILEDLADMEKGTPPAERFLKKLLRRKPWCTTE